jgi:hypothetical protein
MFNLMDDFYQDTKDDCLGSLLGGFSPHLFTDSMPADSAAWNDWENTVNKITVKEWLTSDEVLRATREFIDFHQNEFGFDLKWLIKELDTISVDSEKWLKTLEKAMRE